MNLFALLSTVERQLLGIGAIEISDTLTAVTRFILLSNYQDAVSTETSSADLARIIKYV
jgi:hypothetical protein